MTDDISDDELLTHEMEQIANEQVDARLENVVDIDERGVIFRVQNEAALSKLLDWLTDFTAANSATATHGGDAEMEVRYDLSIQDHTTHYAVFVEDVHFQVNDG